MRERDIERREIFGETTPNSLEKYWQSPSRFDSMSAFDVADDLIHIGLRKEEPRVSGQKEKVKLACLAFFIGIRGVGEEVPWSL